MLNSLSIQTWPIFEITDSRKTELLNTINNDENVLERLRLVAEDVYGWEYDRIDEIKPAAIVDMIVAIADSKTLHDRPDIDSMSLCDVHGAIFRVAVAAEFIGHQGLVGDSNTSDQYSDMQFLNGSDRLFELCEYYSKIDNRELA